ncbi:MAG: transcriptional regulator [Polyangiales bacterium]
MADTLKPIRTNAQHAAAMREVDTLVGENPRPKTALHDRLEALTILIEAFERSHPDHRIEPATDPIAAIEFHLERLGKEPKDLEAILDCTRSRVWEILHRRRALTLPQIRALTTQLGIPAERLIADYPLRRAPAGASAPRGRTTRARTSG